MQRSHSMHLNLSAGDLDALTGSRPSESSPPRQNGTLPRTSSGSVVVDMSRSSSMEKVKQNMRLQTESCIHSIPLIIVLCYFCLWIATSGLGAVQDKSLAANS